MLGGIKFSMEFFFFLFSIGGIFFFKGYAVGGGVAN
jgi:hypothetical protein